MPVQLQRLHLNPGLSALLPPASGSDRTRHPHCLLCSRLPVLSSPTPPWAPTLPQALRAWLPCSVTEQATEARAASEHEVRMERRPSEAAAWATGSSCSCVLVLEECPGETLLLFSIYRCGHRNTEGSGHPGQDPAARKEGGHGFQLSAGGGGAVPNRLDVQRTRRRVERGWAGG